NEKKSKREAFQCGGCKISFAGEAVKSVFFGQYRGNEEFSRFFNQWERKLKKCFDSNEENFERY
ncbi:hypothetical protein NPIL_310611, partial [Nephila pilipes]